jgi:hypothetical protein
LCSLQALCANEQIHHDTLLLRLVRAVDARFHALRTPLCYSGNFALTERAFCLKYGESEKEIDAVHETRRWFLSEEARQRDQNRDGWERFRTRQRLAAAKVLRKYSTNEELGRWRGCVATNHELWLHFLSEKRTQENRKTSATQESASTHDTALARAYGGIVQALRERGGEAGTHRAYGRMPCV